MAVSQSQIVDLLYKQAFGVTKTDTATNKSPSNESIASPLLIRGDTQWTQSNAIPGTAAATAGIVQAYLGVNAIECTADNTTVPIGGIYPTWLTGLTYWIPSEFGSTYNIQIWVDSPGVADPTATGTQIFADGSGGNGQWYYNYQSGVLNFIGETIPASLTAGKVLYVVGYRYIGLVGVTNLPSGTIVGNLSFSGSNISSTSANANINLTPNGTGVVVSSANVYAPTFFGNVVGNISGNITIGGSNTQLIFNDDGLANGNANLTFNKANSLLTLSGILSVSGNASFGGNVNMNSQWINNLANPSVATDAATKQYVDDSVSAGLTIHTPVYVESPNTAGSLNATYADGGTTQIVTTITGNKTLQFGTSPALAVNDVIVFATTTNGLTAGTAYFVYSTNGSNQVTLSTSFDGVEITSLTNGTGLSISSLANSGVGATLTSNVNQLLIVDGITMAGGERVLIYNQTNGFENGVYVVTDAGSAGTPWILTRSADTNTYGPKSTNQLDIGDYFFVQAGDTGEGESYVVTSPPGVIIFGTTTITFTQFSSSQVYQAGDGLTLTNTTFSVNTAQPNITSVGTLTSLSVSGNANIGNIGTGGLITATGNLNAGNIITGGLITAVGNGTFGNIDTAGLLTVTGNITGANIITGGIVSATGNGTFGNIDTAGLLTVTGNANVGNIGTGGLILALGNITGGNLVTGGVVTATGNVTGANIVASNGVYGVTANFTGNLISLNADLGNLATANFVNVASNTITNNLTVNLELAGNTANFSGNIVSLNANLGNLALANFINVSSNLNVTDTANVGNLRTDNLLHANGTPWDFQQPAGSNTQIQYNDGNGGFGASANFTYNDATQLLSVTGNTSITGNANVGNLNTSGSGGNITMTGGNITGANVVFANTFTAASNVNIGNTQVGWSTTTTSNIDANQTIAEFSTTGIAAIEFLVKGLDATGAKYSVATVTAITNGSNVDYVTYATAFLNSGTGALAVNISGGNVALQVTPSSSNSTVWTTQYRVM